MKIVNIGSMNIDHVYQLDGFVRPGETITSRSYKQHLGGKGLNQSIAISRSGSKVMHAGYIGQGGDWIKEELSKNNVDVCNVEVTDSTQGHAIIQVNAEGENSIFLYKGTNFMFTKSVIDEILSKFEKGDILVLQNEVNLLEYIIERAHSIGMIIVLNPSPVTAEILNLDYSMIDWVLLNSVEGQMISRKSKTEEVINYFVENYKDLNVVLTLGKNGSVCISNEKRYYQDAFLVDVVDTTGAGDTFTGYFISNIFRGKSIEDSLQMASAASALSVMVHGASSSIPYEKNVLDFLKNYKEIEK